MQFLEVQKKDLKGLDSLIGSEFPYTKKSEKSIDERFRSDDFFFFKVVLDGKLVGFCEIKISEDIAFIRGFAVKDESRGKGVGEFLLTRIIDFASGKNINEIILLVAKDNSIAKKLYSKAGFRKIRALDKEIDGQKIEEMKLELIV